MVRAGSGGVSTNKLACTRIGLQQPGSCSLLAGRGGGGRRTDPGVLHVVLVLPSYSWVQSSGTRRLLISLSHGAPLVGASDESSDLSSSANKLVFGSQRLALSSCCSSPAGRGGEERRGGVPQARPSAIPSLLHMGAMVCCDAATRDLSSQWSFGGGAAGPLPVLAEGQPRVSTSIGGPARSLMPELDDLAPTSGLSPSLSRRLAACFFSGSEGVTSKRPRPRHGWRSPETGGGGSRGLDCFLCFSPRVLFVSVRPFSILSSLARVLNAKGLTVICTCHVY